MILPPLRGTPELLFIVIDTYLTQLSQKHHSDLEDELEEQKNTINVLKYNSEIIISRIGKLHRGIIAK
jgi:uncharacterized protein YllA (UPF0747 family)